MVDKKLSSFPDIQPSDIKKLICLFLDQNNAIKNGNVDFATLDALLAHKAEAETFTGNKTFSGDTVFSGSTTFNNDINGNISGNAETVTNGVYTTSNNTLSGNNTFTGNVNLGSKATATTQNISDNDTSVATTAFTHNFANGMRSNCITEIPQDINLTLSSGTLTLKAGSKVYVPNGSGTFNVVTIAQDISRSAFGTDTGDNRYIFPVYSNGAITGLSWGTLNNVSSGTTPPTTGTFYNTSTNYINNYSGGSVADQRGFPIGMMTLNSGTPTSIDQVFNGFGYIGNTVFALPGVKALAPNGINSDGTLKNTEYNPNSVLTFTFNTGIWGDGFPITIGQYGLGYLGNSTTFIGGERPSNPSSYTRWYNTEENQWYTYTTSWEKSSFCVYGSVKLSNGKVASLKTKTAFQALDYSDFNNLTSSYLSSICQGKYKEKTILFQGPSTGSNITLSSPYTNFDALLVVGSGDHTSFNCETNIITKDELDIRRADAAVYAPTWGSWNLFQGGGGLFWECNSDSTTTSFLTYNQNCQIQRIYGIKF